MDAKLKEQKPPKAKIMLWTDVSYHDMEEIDKLQSAADLESTLNRVFQFDIPEPQKGVLLELYVQSVFFCRENGFSKEQTSAVLSIIKSIHEVNIETSLDNREHCCEYCKELLLCHSVRRPPVSVNLFSLKEATCILEYIHNSYITHFKLYKYIFTPQEKLDLYFSYSGVSEENILAGEDSAVSDVDNVTEAEIPQKETSLQTQEVSNLECEGATLVSMSELRALIEQEIRQQMMLVSGQLDQRLKEIAAQHSSAQESTQHEHTTINS
ncbi:coiled-coil domain-containing protein 189-like [Thalassophryne amazonica]|uniref:coiled-coil domain-containing protein 189-like n=1 Tax=Thalassophryne amazonica TaxID=390379 RepID=UPI001470F3D5|nr:coiled-coil domain-containing protein 189-like [Thalassophryne amazonica]